jgi:adenine deaminase
VSTALRPELLPTHEELALLRRVAIGQAPADLIVRGGLVLAVHTGEFLQRDVVISGRHIAAVTPVGHFDCDNVIDASGKHVVPTFIDAHLHIEWTMLTPGELARVSVARGTTTVLTDPDGLANVAGLPGMDFMRETGTPLRIFEQVSPSTPVNAELERGGAVVPELDVLDRLADPRSVSLGEGNPFDLGDVARPSSPASASPATAPGRAARGFGATSRPASATTTTRRPSTRCSNACASAP